MEPANAAKSDGRKRQRTNASSVVSDFFFNWSLIELSGMVLSLAATAAIIGVLLQYHDRPLQDWPYHITINTLISFLNSLAKGSMLLVIASAISQLKWSWFHHSGARPLNDMQLFDNASRGPL